MKKIIFITLICNLFFSTASQAEQMIKLGKWDVHYIAFPSTFVQPKIANAVGIKRRGNVAIINISILNRKTQTGQKATITGQSKSLIGHINELSFIEVDEGDAVYYLAEVEHINRENYNFDITFTVNETETHTFNFKQQLYTHSE